MSRKCVVCGTKDPGAGIRYSIHACCSKCIDLLLEWYMKGKLKNVD